MTFDRDEQFLHEKLSADLHPAPVDLWPAVAENLPPSRTAAICGCAWPRRC